MVNWPLAIARNRAALSRIADMLLAMAGLGDGKCAAALPHPASRPSSYPHPLSLPSRGREDAGAGFSACRDAPGTDDNADVFPPP